MGKLIRNGIEYGGGNGTDIFEVTQAEYDALVQAGTLVHNALYVITDAPNLNPTACDIEYSSGVTVKQAIDDLQVVAVSISSKSSKISNDITTAFRIGKVLYISSAFNNNTNWVGGNDTVFTINNIQVVNETYFTANTGDNSGYGYMSVRNSGSNIEFRIGFNVASGHYVAFNAVILLA